MRFKPGDEVIVVKQLHNGPNYPYINGYIFTISEKKLEDEPEWIYKEGDEEWYTEEHCLRLVTKLDKALG